MHYGHTMPFAHKVSMMSHERILVISGTILYCLVEKSPDYPATTGSFPRAAGPSGSVMPAAGEKSPVPPQTSANISKFPHNSARTRHDPKKFRLRHLIIRTAQNPSRRPGRRVRLIFPTRLYCNQGLKAWFRVQNVPCGTGDASTLFRAPASFRRDD